MIAVTNLSVRFTIRAICLLAYSKIITNSVYSKSLQQGFSHFRVFFLILQVSSVKCLVDKTNMGPFFIWCFYFSDGLGFAIFLLLTENPSKILPIFQFHIWSLTVENLCPLLGQVLLCKCSPLNKQP